MAEKPLQQVFDTVRVPLYQEAVFNPAPNSAITGQVYQYYHNCFPSEYKNNLTGESDIWISKRNGFFYAGFSCVGVVTGSAVIAVDNICISQLTDVFVCALYDQSNSKHCIVQYRPTFNAMVLIGEITGTSITDSVYLSELNAGGTVTLGVVWHKADYSNSRAFVASGSSVGFPAASLTQITDTDFPSNLGTPDHLTGPMVWMDTFVFVMGRSGTIYHSDSNTPTSWSGRTIQAIQYPDLGVGLCRYKNYIVAFGQDSIEFFYDAGNAFPASVLSKTDQAFIKFGCKGPSCFTSVDDKLYWIAQSSAGTIGLWELDGFTPVKISTDKEEDLFSSGVNKLRTINFLNKKCLITDANVTIELAAAAGHASFSPNQYSGDPYGAQIFDFTGGLLCYNIENKVFWSFQHGVVAGSPTNRSQYFPYSATALTADSFGDLNSYVVIGGTSLNTEPVGCYFFGLNNTSGNTGQFTDYWLDTLPYQYGCAIQTNTLDFGNEKIKRIHKAKVIQKILHTSATYPNIWLVWNKTDFVDSLNSLSEKRLFVRSVTTSNDTTRYYFTNLGHARQWSFCIVCKSQSQWQVQALEFDISQGTY